jgi:hypothetical protein
MVRRSAVLALLTALAVSTLAIPQASASGSSFTGVVAKIDATTAASMTGVSWQPGCPVALADLRTITLTYWGFDNVAHLGTLVVHRRQATRMVKVFRRLYDARFPIEQMLPIEAFAGDDDASTKANNTSGFNCRKVAGSKSWSQHAWGAAVDINPLQNPYVDAHGAVLDPAAEVFVDRTRTDAGIITRRGVVVKAFAAQGWRWGGNWRSIKDYQHFSANGR